MERIVRPVDYTTPAVGNAASPFHGCAQVRTADHITRYTRVGSGRPVVVLDPIPGAATLWPELLDGLAQHHRVVVPEVPEVETRFTTWLRGFVDGMGLPRMTLVATGDLCMPAMEFALLDPDRVERLVLVPEGRVEETGLAGILSPTMSSSDVSILVVRREHPSEEARRVIERFLRGDNS